MIEKPYDLFPKGTKFSESEDKCDDCQQEPSCWIGWAPSEDKWNDEYWAYLACDFHRNYWSKTAMKDPSVYMDFRVIGLKPKEPDTEAEGWDD